jgi:hypothetical protein
MSTIARARNALLKYRAELEQAHAAHLAEIDQILRELETDIEEMPKIPVRNMVLTAVQRAPRRGRTRAEIIQFVEQRFGTTVKKSTATGTLNRLRIDGLIEFVNGVWFPIQRG